MATKTKEMMQRWRGSLQPNPIQRITDTIRQTFSLLEIKDATANKVLMTDSLLNLSAFEFENKDIRKMSI